MKICIPVSASDVHLLPLFTKLLVKHGNLHQHSILLAPTFSVEAEAYSAASELRGICPAVEVHTCPDFDGGWPQAPNQHWAHVAMHLQTTGNSYPWFWMELDTVPLQFNWADELQREYNRGGKPLMGVQVPTLVESPSGKMVPEPGDTTMLGVAIYPSYVTNLVNMAPLFGDLLKVGDYAVKDPFDHYLRWVFNRAGVAHTEAIQDQWDTGEYELVGDSYVGKPLRTRIGRERSGVVPKSALLVHGCKDESLMRLVLGESGESEEKVDWSASVDEAIRAPIEESEVVQIHTEPPSVQDVLNCVKLLNDEKKYEVYNGIYDMLFPQAAAPIALSEPQKTPEPLKPQPELPKSRFILGPVTEEEEAAFPCTKQQFVEWLESQPKRPRLREMQEKFGYDNLDHARRAIKHWGYEAQVPHTFIKKVYAPVLAQPGENSTTPNNAQ